MNSKRRGDSKTPEIQWNPPGGRLNETSSIQHANHCCVGGTFGGKLAHEPGVDCRMVPGPSSNTAQ